MHVSVEISLTRTYLDSGFGQVDFKCYLLAHKDVWISRLAEQSFEDVELVPREGRPFASLLSRVHAWKLKVMIFNSEV